MKGVWIINIDKNEKSWIEFQIKTRTKNTDAFLFEIQLSLAYFNVIRFDKLNWTPDKNEHREYKRIFVWNSTQFGVFQCY